MLLQYTRTGLYDSAAHETPLNNSRIIAAWQGWQAYDTNVACDSDQAQYEKLRGRHGLAVICS